MNKRWIVMTLILSVALIGVVAPAHAEHEEQDTGRLVLTKLFRGIANLTTGWLEIPKQITFTTQEMGGGAGATWGLVKGLGFAIARTASGAYELVTFPFPAPDGYKPIMDPEYVLSDLPENPQPSRSICSPE